MRRLLLFCCFAFIFTLVFSKKWTAEELASESRNKQIIDPEHYIKDDKTIFSWIYKIEDDKKFRTYFFVISEIDTKYKGFFGVINIELFVNDLSYLVLEGNKEFEKSTIFILFSIDDRLMRIRTGETVGKDIWDYTLLSLLESLKSLLRTRQYTTAFEKLMMDLHQALLEGKTIPWLKILAIALFIGGLCWYVNRRKRDYQVEGKLERIRVITKRNTSKKSFVTTNCIICLEDFERNEETSKLLVQNDDVSKQEEELISKLDCGHSFHSKCIQEWMKKQNTCPICREKIDAEENSKPLAEDLVNVQRTMLPSISTYNLRYVGGEVFWDAPHYSSSGGSSYSSSWNIGSGGATSSW